MEEKLQEALSEKLSDLEDKVKNAEHARLLFGEDMYKKLIAIDVSKSEALLFDRGNVNIKGCLNSFQR